MLPKKNISFLTEGDTIVFHFPLSAFNLEMLSAGNCPMAAFSQ